MEISRHISALLFEHDCVIIPDFGGFVCNYSPAFIQEGKSQFHPPFKKISFNRNLKNNDGLLANQISQAEKIPYSEATRLISESAAYLNKELSSSERLELKHIGTFYLAKENTILFEQNTEVNYLPQSFGLSTFYSPAIKREPIERKFERTVKDKVIVPSKEKHDGITKRRTPVLRYVAAAASLLIITSLVFISLKTDLMKNTNFANLNPFAEKAVALYNPDADALPDNDVAKENVSNLLALNRNDTTRYLNIMINGNIPIVVSLQDDKTAVVQTKSNDKHKSNGRFNIIGGAFSVPENAEKFLSKLKSLGYDARIIDRKLRLVSYGSFSTREEALQAMEKIKTIQSDVWLMSQ